jgi:hypothetical protein
MLTTVNKCPDCGATMTGKVGCVACGWNRPQEKKADVQSGMRCAYHGTYGQCRNIGTVTSSTSGSAIWFCYDHFTCKTADHGDEIITKSERALNGRATSYSVGDCVRAAKKTFIEKVNNGAESLPVEKRYALKFLKNLTDGVCPF